MDVPAEDLFNSPKAMEKFEIFLVNKWNVLSTYYADMDEFLPDIMERSRQTSKKNHGFLDAYTNRYECVLESSSQAQDNNGQESNAKNVRTIEVYVSFIAKNTKENNSSEHKVFSAEVDFKRPEYSSDSSDNEYGKNNNDDTVSKDDDVDSTDKE